MENVLDRLRKVRKETYDKIDETLKLNIDKKIKKLVEGLKDKIEEKISKAFELENDGTGLSQELNDKLEDLIKRTEILKDNCQNFIDQVEEMKEEFEGNVGPQEADWVDTTLEKKNLNEEQKIKDNQVLKFLNAIEESKKSIKKYKEIYENKTSIEKVIKKGEDSIEAFKEFLKYYEREKSSRD